MLIIIVLIILVTAVVLTYVISKLKFEKNISTLEERISSLNFEKDENEKENQKLASQIEDLRTSVHEHQMNLVKKDAALDHSAEKLKEQADEVSKLQEKFSRSI